MEMQVQFNPHDYARLQKQLETTYKATGITVQWLCWDQMRLYIADGIKYVAPWANGSPGNGRKQKLVGEGAVEKDLENLFAKIDEQKYAFWTQKSGQPMAKDKATKKVFKIDPERWNVKNLSALHLKNRNDKGRVKKQDRQYWTRPEAFSDYVKEVKARVGKLKAAWLPAYRYFQAKVGGGKNVSAWISRHAGQGTYIDAMTQDGNGRLIAVNSAPHNNAIRKDTIDFIVRNRQKSVNKYTPKRLQQIADQFNANRTTIQPIRQNALE